MKPFFRRDTHKGEGVPLTKHQTCWTSRDSRVFSSHANIFRTKRIQTGGGSSVSRSIGPSVADLVSINESRRREKTRHRRRNLPSSILRQLSSFTQQPSSIGPLVAENPVYGTQHRIQSAQKSHLEPLCLSRDAILRHPPHGKSKYQHKSECE